MLYIDLANRGVDCQNPYLSQAVIEYLETQTKFGDETLIGFTHSSQPTVTCGVNQNIFAEVNVDYLKKQQFTLARRSSGGGAIYDDAGSLTYFYVDSDRGTNYQQFDLYAQTMLKVLHELGVPAIMNGRTDLTVADQRCSSLSSARIKQRFSCGGTLMLDVDMAQAKAALQHVAIKGVPSVQHRMTNIRPYLRSKYRDITRQQIQNLFLQTEFQTTDLTTLPTYHMTAKDWQAVTQLATTKYSTPEWIYGSQQTGTHFHARHFANLGTIEFAFTVQHGVITQIKIYGDFALASGNLQLIEQNLIGVSFQLKPLIDAFQQSNLPKNLGAFQPAALAKILLEEQYALPISSFK